MCRKFSALAAAIFLSCAVASADTEQDFRIARLSHLDGHVSVQHATEAEWSSATINLALQPGDRIYTGSDGRVEVEFDDGSILRLAEKTDAEILTMGEDLIQVRILLGLASLTVRSGLDFEINTPAAAFSTLRKGFYRFDVAENGESDGIVRQGKLHAASNSFSREAEDSELIHATPGDQGTAVLARYDTRDAWDEWNDRRNAELDAYASRNYIPESVYIGVRDLDHYGRWVEADYGPAWIPNVSVGWSPYWDGRWVYRPFWGWTWVSYEPWGWLPYHYGRWHHSASFGWCWLPGASFGFNFWSPGLVRFYHGPSWVSWCPLGPGDYYNVNRYFHRRVHHYQLNNLRLVQRRAPDDLANRHVPGAFRTASTDRFLNNRLGGPGRGLELANVDQPWRTGRMITDRLPLQPTARSFSADPERPAMRPVRSEARPVVVRTEPATRRPGTESFTRITNPAMRSLAPSRVQMREQGRSLGTPGAGAAVGTSPQGSGRTTAPPNSIDRGSGVWNRRIPGAETGAPSGEGRSYQSLPQAPRNEGSRYGRNVPGSSAGRNLEARPPAGSAQDGTRNIGRDSRPVFTPQRQLDSTPGRSPAYQRPSVPSSPSAPSTPQRRVEPDRPRPSTRPSEHSMSFAPRSYQPRTEPQVYSGRPGTAAPERISPGAGRWQTPSFPAGRESRSWGRTSGFGGYSPPAATRGGGQWSSGSGFGSRPSGMRSAPQARPSSDRSGGGSRRGHR
jgi:hypothetical protein